MNETRPAASGPGPAPAVAGSPDGAARDAPPWRLGELYARHAPDAVRLARLLTGDAALAQDLVQDAFVRLGGRLVHLRRPDAFEAYLRRTVVNLARMHFRRRRVERAHAERQRRAPDPVAPGDAVEDRDLLRAALLRLPERQRAALVLRFYEDLPDRAIAEVLRCRPGTVASLVSRGLTRLRTELKE